MADMDSLPTRSSARLRQRRQRAAAGDSDVTDKKEHLKSPVPKMMEVNIHDDNIDVTSPHHRLLHEDGEQQRTSDGEANGGTSIRTAPEPSDTETVLNEQELKKGLLGKDSDDDLHEKKLTGKEETEFTILLQVLLPYIIAGFGTVAAGMVLDIVQHWSVFHKVPELFILVPPLLGLKGNLGMTLASRLSTQVNLGYLDEVKEQWKSIGGNTVLTQGQSIVTAFVASVLAVAMGWVPEGKFNINHVMLMGASSILTNCLASLFLGILMMLVVLYSRKLNINPDNIATPLSASLGDLVTIVLLATSSSWLYDQIELNPWLSPAIVLVSVIVLTPMWLILATKYKYTRDVVYHGWTPVICAVAISSVGGLILDYAVTHFHGLAVFQPVINGVGGNLVAVQASRLATSLHRVSKPGIMPENAPRACANPCTAFCGKGPHSRTARVLLGLVVPGHLLFMCAIALVGAGHTTITARFTAVYLLAAVIQVIVLLYLANWMVHFMWKSGDDPDNFAIPYLTAVGDFLGTALLALAFQTLHWMGDKDGDVGE